MAADWFKGGEILIKTGQRDGHDVIIAGVQGLPMQDDKPCEVWHPLTPGMTLQGFLNTVGKWLDDAHELSKPLVKPDLSGAIYEVVRKGQTFVSTATDKDGTLWILCEEDCHHETPESADKCPFARETAAIYSEPAGVAG